MRPHYFIFDFDSTFVQVEALDELAAIALQTVPEREKIITQIKDITQLGMEGKIPFQESLSRRINLFSITRKHIEEVIELLQSRVSASFQRNKEFFHRHADSIFIISGGFKEYICPVVAEFGIAESRVLANTFIFNSVGDVIGYDTANFLSQSNGKVLQVAALNLSGQVTVIGDGFTDYQIRATGNADQFIAYTENVRRESIIQNADLEASSIDQVISTLPL